MTSATTAIRRELESLGTPERAAGEKRYLESDLDFLGATLGDIRRVTKESLKRTAPTHAALIDLVEELWGSKIFELRMAASILLGLRVADLGPSDLGVIERLLRESRTWALVDVLAGDVVGGIALSHDICSTLDGWASDEDFWLRRSSLLAELKPLKAARPFESFARRADAMLDEKEFFIRKAIGWVLRETSKKRADEVYAWIAPRTHRAPGVTMREVVKYLDPERAGRLMAAYTKGVPAA
jgi:3-methyladenine DNA glycosylase AlkD